MHRSLYICAVLTGHEKNLVTVCHIEMIGHVIHACKTDTVCEYSREVALLDCWAAEIEGICMILYMLIYKYMPGELVVKV